MRRIATLVLAAAAALLAGGPGALAFWSAPGTGTGASRTATLRHAVVEAAASGATVTITWTAEAELAGDSAAAIAYRVLRKGPGEDSYTTLTRGGCAGPLARPAATCEDTAPAAGTYDYRVLAVYRSWTALADAGTVTVEAPPKSAPPQDLGPAEGAAPDGAAAAPADAPQPEHGAAAVALDGDADGWIDAAGVAAVAVRVELRGPAAEGDQVFVELRDAAGVVAEGSATIVAGATSVVVGDIDARPLAETSSSVADPAAARGLTLTARVADAAGTIDPASASGAAGKDVTAPPSSGEHALVARLESGADGLRLVGSGEPYDAVSVVPIAGSASAVSGTVTPAGVLGPVALSWPAAGGARVTATDPAGNALTLDVPAEPGAIPAA